MDLFYHAAVPEPTTILGLRLRPFSLGHKILLGRVESAFEVGGIPDFSDLALSVFICSQTYHDAVAAFNDTDLPRFMFKWHQKLTGADRWMVRLGFRKPKQIYLVAKCSEFGDYIKRGSEIRNYSYNPEDVHDVFCPTVQLIKVTLMAELGFTESELLDRPWALCLDDFIVHKAIKGSIRLHDSDAVADAAEVGRQLAEALAKRGVKVNGVP